MLSSLSWRGSSCKSRLRQCTARRCRLVGGDWAQALSRIERWVAVARTGNYLFHRSLIAGNVTDIRATQNGDDVAGRSLVRLHEIVRVVWLRIAALAAEKGGVGTGDWHHQGRAQQQDSRPCR
jgi:hypothetical protein